MKLLTLITLFTAVSITSAAQWNTDTMVRNAICTADRLQTNPNMCTDGHGGAIIAWDDYRVSGVTPIYKFFAQRIDSSGNNKWAGNGIEIPYLTGAGISAVTHMIVSDNHGGAILFYEIAGDYIYAQKIDSNGVLQWGPTGVPISTAQDSRLRSAEYAVTNQAAGDGDGGAFVTWQQYGFGGNYAQHIDKNGNTLWGTNGLRLTSIDSSFGYTSFIVSTGAGTAAVAFCYKSPLGSHLYMQRIAANGNFLWAKPSLIATDYSESVASDNAFLYYDSISAQKSLFISWTDVRNIVANGADVYVQKVDTLGNLLWAASGMPVSTTSFDDYNTHLITDGNGGFFMAYNSAGVKLQHVNGAGQLLWGPNGMPASSAGGTYNPVIVRDGNAGFIAMWVNNGALTAQRYTPFGSALWRANGIPVIAVPISINHSATPLVLSNNGSAIAAWSTNASNSHIYAAKVGGTDGLLPVNFSSFNAWWQKSTVQLQWATAQEQNSRYFEVQRSENAQHFTPLLTVAASGNSASGQTYSAVDANPLPGTNYYRIKELDKSGGVVYSRIVAVNMAGESSISVTPNPSRNNASISIIAPAQNTSISMYSATGQLVMQKQVSLKSGVNIIHFNISAMAPGNYFIKVANTGLHAKLLVQ